MLKLLKIQLIYNNKTESQLNVMHFEISYFFKFYFSNCDTLNNVIRTRNYSCLKNKSNAWKNEEDCVFPCIYRGIVLFYCMFSCQLVQLNVWGRKCLCKKYLYSGHPSNISQNSPWQALFSSWGRLCQCILLWGGLCLFTSIHIYIYI